MTRLVRLESHRLFLQKVEQLSKKVYMPVPYNVSFELSIMSKLSDDALQILEQIVPYFQPSFNITINLIDSIGEKKIYRLF